MKTIGFYLVKWWVDFQSIQPYWLLYLKSDLYYLLVYHVARYRRKVVRQNLLRSFPEKDAKSIKTIEKHFYRNLCDLVVEGPKMMRMGPNGYRKRLTFVNTELIAQLEEKHKNIFFIKGCKILFLNVLCCICELKTVTWRWWSRILCYED